MKRARILLALAAVGLGLFAGCGGGEEAVQPPTFAELIPHPEVAAEDKGPSILDGCRSGVDYTEAWTCVYGDPASEKTVVLWGDSHAMQFAPPMIELAEARGWRLVTIFRGSCLVADVPFQPACDAWRENALARIENERPDRIITATDTGNGYALGGEGNQRDLIESTPTLVDAYARTLNRLVSATGDRPGGVLVIRDFPRADDPPPECLVKHPEEMEVCDFKGFRRNPPGFDVEAVRLVRKARLADPATVVCPTGTCPATTNGMVVFRDTAHLTATYAATLAGWLGEQIGDV